jgi:hypothetical protein
VESAEAPKRENEIVMLLDFFDELRRKVLELVNSVTLVRNSFRNMLFG